MRVPQVGMTILYNDGEHMVPGFIVAVNSKGMVNVAGFDETGDDFSYKGVTMVQAGQLSKKSQAEFIADQKWAPK